MRTIFGDVNRGFFGDEVGEKSGDVDRGFFGDAVGDKYRRFNRRFNRRLIRILSRNIDITRALFTISSSTYKH